LLEIDIILAFYYTFA